MDAWCPFSDGEISTRRSSVSSDESGARAAVAELRKQQPQFTFKTFARSEHSVPTTSPVYKNWWGTTLIPACRRAGLPE
jgi:hypothetical protein